MTARDGNYSVDYSPHRIMTTAPHPLPWRRDANTTMARFIASDGTGIAIAEVGSPNDALWTFIVGLTMTPTPPSSVRTAASTPPVSKDTSGPKAAPHRRQGETHA